MDNEKPFLHIEWIMRKVMKFSDEDIAKNNAIRKREKREQKLKRILGDEQ